MFKYEIVKRICTLREYEKNGETWSKEVNLVSWNERKPKIDIREWNSNHSRMNMGITLTDEEAAILVDWLGEYCEERSN